MNDDLTWMTAAKKAALEWLVIGRLARLSLLGLVLLSACGSKPSVWKEEVRLQSQEVIQIRRTIRFKAYQPIGGGGGSDTPESTLEVIAPVRADNPSRWSQPSLLPMVLDRDPDTREWFVVATFFMCTAWYELGRPPLPYAEFRFRDGRWIRQPLSEKLIGREANVLVPDQADVGRDHTLASKGILMSNPEISAEYRRIVSKWKTSC